MTAQPSRPRAGSAKTMFQPTPRPRRPILELPSSFKPKAAQPDLESDFEQLWKRLAKGWPVPVREYTFSERRKFRFDFAFVPEKLAIEMEGGIFAKGAHTRGKHYWSDCQKYNLATELSWAVLRYTANDLAKWPMDVIEQIQAVLRMRGIEPVECTEQQREET